MFRAAVLVTFAVAVSAAAWPMITVNSAGEIVLNSPTKANAFQVVATTATAAPTSGTTASTSTVTALSGDNDAYIVSVPSSPASQAGFKLPTPTVGKTVTFYNDGTGKGAFSIWTSATTVYFDGTTTTTIDIASTTSWVQCTATSTTNWVVKSNAANAATNGKGYQIYDSTSVTATATLTTAQVLNSWMSVTNTAAATLTTPSASSLTSADVGSTNYDAYTFTLTNAATVVAATDLTITLAAGTGVTIPSDGTQFVIPGQTRVYSLYRTSSSAWTIAQKSSYIIYPSTYSGFTATANTAASTAFTVTMNSPRWMQSVARGTSLGSATFSSVYVNAYAQMRDTVLVSKANAVVAAVDTVTQRENNCWVSAAGSITCIGAGNNQAVTYNFNIMKA